MKALQKYGMYFMSTLWLVPSFAHAQVIPGGKSIWQIAEGPVKYIVTNLVPVLVSIAVVLIIFNIIRYVLLNNNGSQKASDVGKQLGYSIGGLFVILAIWGIIAIVSKTLGIGIGGGPIAIPTVPLPTP